MAIKGKKKSQRRGSQARRRPAAAPRPTTGRGTKKPWYRTTAGQSIAAIAVLVAVVIALVLVNNARTQAEEREVRQQSLENFTDQVEALVQTITPPASELSTAAQMSPEELAESAPRWRDAFTAAQTRAAQFPPVEGTTTVRQLFAQSLSLYQAAAAVMAQAAELDPDARTELLATAANQVASASAVWLAAVDVLDAARDEAGLNASGIRAPTEAPPSGEAPAPAATVPVEPGDDATAGGKAGGKGGGGKGGDGGAGKGGTGGGNDNGNTDS